MRRVGLMAVVVALVFGFSSCASPRQDRSPIPAATQTAPPSGSGPGLRDLGFENGPTNVAMPSGIEVAPSVDQPNVVTVFFRKPDPATSLGALRNNLRAAGFRITSDAGGSLVFAGAEWTGSYTATGDLNAITFRRR